MTVKTASLFFQLECYIILRFFFLRFVFSLLVLFPFILSFHLLIPFVPLSVCFFPFLKKLFEIFTEYFRFRSFIFWSGHFVLPCVVQAGRSWEVSIRCGASEVFQGGGDVGAQGYLAPPLPWARGRVLNTLNRKIIKFFNYPQNVDKIHFF